MDRRVVTHTFAVAAVVCTWGVASPQPLAAQQPRPNPPPAAPQVEKPAGAKRAVLLVMESPGGLRAAGGLRTSLNAQPGLQVVSLAEATQKQLNPAAIVTVAAVTARAVNVVYWDFTGTRDALSAPTPERADQLDAVVLALASALLDRHRGEWADARPVVLGARDDALYAVLGRFIRPNSRTNIALHFEDF